MYSGTIIALDVQGECQTLRAIDNTHNLFVNAEGTGNTPIGDDAFLAKEGIEGRS
jgi:hypothetical protein